mmetsp:Transcript_2041/g.2791  ORF Transcript_2041/g.2791 Transcript_2041/m.2791 type:complete len:203 (-) Transcript_2041:2067-2675(-)
MPALICSELSSSSLRAAASCRKTFFFSARWNSFRVSSEGASPCSRRNCASSSPFWRCSFSCCSRRAVAWYMESSETEASIFLVTSLILPCSSFSWSASILAASLFATACERSFSVRAVTSSSTSSLSSTASRFLSRRSSSTCILAASCSRSGSLPSRGRQRAALPGSSRRWLSDSVRRRSAVSCSSSSSTLRRSCSSCGSLF